MSRSAAARAVVEADAPQAQLLSRVQRQAFDYFMHEVNPANGLVRDKTMAGAPATIAAMGMALTAWPVGVAQGWLTRGEAVRLCLAMLRFLAASEQGKAPDASGYKGFYYHFLAMDTGRREWRCELSSIDTALLIVGALAAAEYFDAASPDEAELRALAKTLYERIDWAWMLNGGPTLSHGWRPRSGFLRYRWQGYDEALILYLLALGSPTFPIPPASYEAFCRSYEWRHVEGLDYLHAGPLFIHQMSHVWCDFRGLRDRVMRERDSDYFDNSRKATLIQQRYAQRNPRGFRQTGPWCWGLSAGDGPGRMLRSVGGVRRRFFDYEARGVPDSPDDGTFSPWAVVASLPFAPEIVLPTIEQLMAHEGGASYAFNPTLGWTSPVRFGINEGPMVLMIENHQSDLVWSLMRRCKPLRTGLARAGFTGGWLD